MTDMGHVINDFHTDRICKLMKDHHGRVMHGNSNAFDDQKLEPTIVLEPSKESDLMKYEIFGPILPVYSF
jgi:aldehyde dehydrogenase (NAD+)